MPKLSSRGIQMPPSPIRKLVPYAEAAAARGVRIHHLNIGQPDINTVPGFMERIRSFDAPVLEYSHSAGLESYRRSYAASMQARGIDLDFRQIMITTGGSEALLFAMLSCLDAGDEVLIPEPFYANYNGFARMAGVEVVPVPTKIENGFALPPLSDWEPLISARTKAVLICHPNNPTGVMYSLSELQQLSELVRRHNLFLFSDEVYRMFAYDGATHHSVLEFPELADYAVVVESVSKVYSACGARIGALMSRNSELMAVALKYGQARLSPPTLEQIGAEAALSAPASYFEQVRSAYESRRNLVVSALRSMPGVVCPHPGGAFYCMVGLPVADADDFCRWMLESFSYKGCTVMLAPGSGFYAQAENGRHQARIAYVLEEDRLSEAMEALAEGLMQYNAQFSPTKAKPKLITPY